jgi:hypothetical protein
VPGSDLGAFKAVVDQHEALFARDQLRCAFTLTK